MIEQLVKMSGTTHEARIDQKTITRDNERVLNKNEGRISYTMQTKERPVIQFNDFMFIQQRNSIIIKAGTSPIWNKNKTAYPMSWRLFQNQINIPGKKFSLQTIPTNSSAKDFDVRKNQPDFFRMLEQRLAQARMADEMKQAYKDAYGYSETDFIRLDQNVVADDIMHAINSRLFNIKHREANAEMEYSEEELEAMNTMDDLGVALVNSAEENTEVAQAFAKANADYEAHKQKRYAGGQISREDLVSMGGAVNRQLDKVLAIAYQESHRYFEDSADFRVDTDTEELRSANGTLYVRSSKGADRDDVERLERAERDPDSRVFSEDERLQETFFEVTDEFIKYLASLESWSHIAGGHFDQEAKRAYQAIKS